MLFDASIQLVLSAWKRGLLMSAAINSLGPLSEFQLRMITGLVASSLSKITSHSARRYDEIDAWIQISCFQTAVTWGFTFIDARPYPI
jgi:hypothetical protein